MIAAVLSIFLIAGSILVHYEMLRVASRGATELKVRPRFRLWMMLTGAIASHLLHVALFAGGFLLIEHVFVTGSLEGTEVKGFNEAFYFAITSYTTLGIGDIYPTGEARLLSGIAALSGLVMITWTASMTYLHMERFWQIDSPPQERS